MTACSVAADAPSDRSWCTSARSASFIRRSSVSIGLTIMKNELRQTPTARARGFAHPGVLTVSVTLLKQRAARSVQPGPGRPDGASNDASGLLVGQFVQLAQDDDLAVA
jgi:hypothetical protein